MTRYQWLLIVIVAGLVGMHHMVHLDAAQTTPMTLVAGLESSSTGPARSVTTLHADPDSMAAQTGCCDPMDTVGHCCLAVLTAIAALASALIFVAARRRPLRPGRLLTAISAGAVRGPPTGCAGLTQLCVLRR
jgi:hypothetical protein